MCSTVLFVSRIIFFCEPLSYVTWPTGRNARLPPPGRSKPFRKSASKHRRFEVLLFVSVRYRIRRRGRYLRRQLLRDDTCSRTMQTRLFRQTCVYAIRSRRRFPTPVDVSTVVRRIVSNGQTDFSTCSSRLSGLPRRFRTKPFRTARRTFLTIRSTERASVAYGSTGFDGVRFIDARQRLLLSEIR